MYGRTTGAAFAYAARHMRTYLASLVVLTACAADVQDPDVTTVQERLAEPTMLDISLPNSAGAITASRKTDEGWVPGLADLRIERGTILLSTEGDVLALDDLVIDVGPIEIPEAVLGYPLQLTDIRLSLVERVKVAGAWTSPDEAHGNAKIDLLLEWSLVNHDVTAPLGSPDLPLIPVELAISGTADRVHAELRASSPGELWKWGNVFRLEDLSLVIAGDTP
jgi:hypothetical protein